MKVNIIGCGLSGITAAILLKNKGYDVEIFETRSHIGGNCYDEKQDSITVHKYGSHIFHTNDEDVWEFLNRYTSFNNYEHKVRANTSIGLISIPYNYKTREQIGRDLSPEEIKELIFRKYSERHWGIKWEDLPASISGRVPTKRDNWDERYFTDKYQGIPANCYAEMFKNMLDGIKVNVGVNKEEYKKIKCDKMIYTGKPDEFYNFQFGKLSYRSLRFEHYKVKKDENFSWEKGSVINECNELPFNRTMDNSVYLNENLSYTILTRDYPEEHDNTNDPIYPKDFGEGMSIYSNYKKLIQAESDVLFLGRLASYKYLDMWMAVKQVMVKINSLD
jgi:UDP-galactopyranose mutase